LYRAPLGDLSEFIKRLDATLKYLYNPESEFLIFRDINIECLDQNNWKKQIISLLTTHNLLRTLNFATGNQSKSGTSVDNIFMDNTRSRYSSIISRK
jgi:hypothetical protein